MKRLGRLGGVLVAIGAAVAGALWLLKDRIAGPPPAPVIPEEAPGFRVAPAEPEAAAIAAPDDLSDVTGIGPVYMARLGEVGISTFAALAAADAAAVAEAAGVNEERAADWIAQAAGLAG
jgi:large subunit ribosomal protein L21